MVLGIELKNANRNNKHETDLTIWARFSLSLDLQDFVDLSANNSYGVSQITSTRWGFKEIVWECLVFEKSGAQSITLQTEWFLVEKQKIILCLQRLAPEGSKLKLETFFLWGITNYVN